MMYLDIVLLLIIAVCILYCFKLSKKIDALFSMKKDFSKMIENMNTSIVTSKDKLEEILSNAQRCENHIKQLIDQSNKIGDEIVFINQSSTSLIKRMQSSIDDGKNIIDKLELLMQQAAPKVEKVTKRSVGRAKKESQDSASQVKSIKTTESKLGKLEQSEYYNTLQKIGTKNEV